METESTKDEDDTMEDDDMAEPKEKSKMAKAQLASKVEDIEAKAVINKSTVSQRIATRSTNTDQHP